MTLPAEEPPQGQGQTTTNLGLRENSILDPTVPGSPPAELPAGAMTIGRFVVRETIGRGGMGSVLRAFDPELERDIALKISHPSMSLRARDLFVREIRVTARLEHPAIVPAYETGRTGGGAPYLVMQLIEGENLEQHLEGVSATLQRRTQRSRGWLRGSLGEWLWRSTSIEGSKARAAVMRRFLKLCEAVEFAHSMGVIHRDIKPANVMIGRFGEVYVMDWGIARAGAEVGAVMGHAEVGEPQTQVGEIVGTPGYMAPEQAAGDPAGIGHWTDIYALGVMLFQIATLRPPHEGYPIARLRRPQDHIRPYLIEHPSERRAPDGWADSWGLLAIARKAMAIEPEARFKSVTDLQLAVEAYLDGRRVPFVDYPWHRRLRLWGGALAVRILGALRPLMMFLALCFLALLIFGLPWILNQDALVRERLVRGMREVPSAQQLRAQIDTSLTGVDSLPAVDLTGKCLDLLAEHEKLDELELDAADRARELELRLFYSCLIAGNNALARRSLAELLRQHGDTALNADLQGLMDRLAQWRLGRARELRRAEEARRERRLATIRDRLGAEVLRPADRQATLEAAVALVTPGTAAQLTPVVDRLALRLADEGTRLLSQLEDQELEMCTRLLGQLDDGAGVAPLARLLAAARPRYAARIAIALCRTDAPAAAVPLATMARRLGRDSEVWEQVQSQTSRLELPSLDLEGPLATHRSLELLLAFGRLDRAREVASTAARAYPAAAWPQVRRGEAELAAGRHAEALAAFERALAIDPKARGAWTGKGQIAYHAGRLEAAVGDLSKALSVRPDEAGALHLRAQALERLGKRREALADHDRLIALRPEDSRWRVNRGLTHWAMKSHQLARRDFLAALVINPGRLEAHVNLAALLNEAGLPALALNHYQQASRLAPQDWQLHAWRAEVLAALERYEEAVQAAGDALLVAPASRRAELQAALRGWRGRK